MEAEKQLADTEKLDIIIKRLKRMEQSQHIQTAITIIVFLGIVSFGALVSDVKKQIK